MSHDILQDGSVVTDGLKYEERPQYPSTKVMSEFFPLSGYVLAVYEIEDPNNVDGEAILCDVHIPSMSVDLFGVPFLGPKSSFDSYISCRPLAHTENLDGSMFSKDRINPEKGNGDTVLVQFIDGQFSNPIITHVLPHSASGRRKISESSRSGVTGDHFKVRIGGTNLEMDKDGNFTIETTKTVDKSIPIHKKFTVKMLTPDGSQKTEFVLDNSKASPKADLLVVDESGKKQQVTLDGAAKEIKILNEFDGGSNSVTFGAAGAVQDVKAKTSEKSGGDHSVDATGKFEVKSAQTDIKASGEAKIAGSGGTKVGSGSAVTDVLGSMVNLGGGGSPVAKVGSQCVGTGNMGAPVISYIVQGSSKVTTA